MHLTVLTLFPDLFRPYWEHGIIRRAVQRKLITVDTLNIRDYAEGRHRVTDDRPYGGGCGMVMKPEPLAAAIRAARLRTPFAHTVLMTPQGRALDQALASNLAMFDGLIVVCGRYEGVDERICQEFIDDEVSIGDYVLTGGEVPAMVLIDAVTRLIPGTLGGEDSAAMDSFASDLLEHGHYTRPRAFEGSAVPQVLLSGHHGDIEKWRLEMSLARTLLKRPDLLKKRSLTPAEQKLLEKWRLIIEELIEAQPVRGPDASSGG